MNRRQAGLIALLCILHLLSLGVWFLGTDAVPLIITSKELTLSQHFRSPIMVNTSFTEIALFYRPLTTLTFAFEYALWGLSPIGYHGSNILLFIASVGLQYKLAHELLDPSPAVLATTIFAIHPLTLQVVPYVARRHDLLATLLLLATLYWYLQSSLRARLFSVSAFSLALLSKEPAALGLGLIVLLYPYGKAGELSISSFAQTVIPYFGVFATYFAARTMALGGLGGYQHTRTAETIPEYSHIVVTIFREVIGSPYNLPVVVVLVVLLTVPLFGFIRSLFSVTWPLSSDLYVFVVAGCWLLGFVSISLIGGTFAERSLYIALPAIGIAIGATWSLLENQHKGFRAILGVYIVVILAASPVMYAGGAIQATGAIHQDTYQSVNNHAPKGGAQIEVHGSPSGWTSDPGLLNRPAAPNVKEYSYETYLEYKRSGEYEITVTDISVPMRKCSKNPKVSSEGQKIILYFCK